MNITILIVWFLVLITTGFAAYFDNLSRMLIPGIGLLAIFIIEDVAKFRFKSMMAVILRRIIAIPFLTLGFNWICIFTLTAYRRHHRPIIIPLSIVFLIIGLMLTHYKINSKR